MGEGWMEDYMFYYKYDNLIHAYSILHIFTQVVSCVGGVYMHMYISMYIVMYESMYLRRGLDILRGNFVVGMDGVSNLFDSSC